MQNKFQVRSCRRPNLKHGACWYSVAVDLCGPKRSLLGVFHNRKEKVPIEFQSVTKRDNRLPLAILHLADIVKKAVKNN